MRTVNRVELLGHVGRDPQINSTDSGSVVANLSLATSYRNKESKDVTEWHRLVAFGRTAEIIRDYVVKGSALYIEGQLQTRSWETDGQTRYTTEVVIRGMSLIGNRSADTSKSAAMNNSEGITDDDIPL